METCEFELNVVLYRCLQMTTSQAAKVSQSAEFYSTMYFK